MVDSKKIASRLLTVCGIVTYLNLRFIRRTKWDRRSRMPICIHLMAGHMFACSQLPAKSILDGHTRTVYFFIFLQILTNYISSSSYWLITMTHLWRERIDRCHKRQYRTTTQLTHIIDMMVQNRLHYLRYQDNPHRWNLMQI